MIIFPAIDMRGGKGVRLLQGRVEAETVYFEDPLSAAQHWVEQGAQWLHLVDLDGAMCGGEGNRDLAKRIFASVHVPVQFGGGVRNLAVLEELLAAGATRVILGTASVEDEGFLTQALSLHADRVVIGLDAQNGMVATRGWRQVEKLEAVYFAKRLAEKGAQRIVYTNIARDGMLAGPDLDSTRQIAEESRLKVIASGGVSSLEDLRRIRQLETCGVEGVIVGKALYEKRFSLRQALESI